MKGEVDTSKPPLGLGEQTGAPGLGSNLGWPPLVTLRVNARQSQIHLFLMPWLDRISGVRSQAPPGPETYFFNGVLPGTLGWPACSLPTLPCLEGVAHAFLPSSMILGHSANSIIFLQSNQDSLVVKGGGQIESLLSQSLKKFPKDTSLYAMGLLSDCLICLPMSYFL